MELLFVILCRALTRAGFFWGVHIHIFVLCPANFFWNQAWSDFNRKQLIFNKIGRVRHEFMNIGYPPIDALITVLILHATCNTLPSASQQELSNEIFLSQRKTSKKSCQSKFSIFQYLTKFVHSGINSPKIKISARPEYIIPGDTPLITPPFATLLDRIRLWHACSMSYKS